MTQHRVSNGLSAWLPFSTLPLTFSEGLMVRRIARVFQVPAEDQDVASVIGAVTGGVVGHLGGEWTKAIGIGLVAHPVIAVGMVQAIGEAAISYFAQRSPLPCFD
jgi:hypothetical protein